MTCGVTSSIFYAGDFVALMSVALLSRTFCPSVEAECTLGVAVCRFSEVLLIVTFKIRFRGEFWFTHYRIN